MISVFWILETKSLASELFYRSSLYTLDSSTSVLNIAEISLSSINYASTFSGVSVGDFIRLTNFLIGTWIYKVTGKVLS